MILLNISPLEGILTMIRDSYHKNLRMTVICSLVAFLLYFVGLAEYLTISLVISLGVGFTTRYAKIGLAKYYPKLHLASQYVIASCLAILIWIVLPIVIRYQFKPEEVNTTLGTYALIFVSASVIAAILSYLYYRTEQSFILQQALDKAEIARVKQDKQILETQLRLLQSQIEPHFLFNTLANIQALISIDPKKSSKMLTALTSLLRQSLNRTRDEWLTLSHELRFNKAYLAIQQIRLGDRLQIKYDISDKLIDSIHFPPMLIQPLIENAVVHGIEPIPEGGVIEFKVAIDEGFLDIHIINDCTQVINSKEHKGHKGHGVGLNNIQERLTRLYGEESEFSYNNQIKGRVIVKMKVPINVPEV